MVLFADVVPSSRNSASTSSVPSPSTLQTSSPWPWWESPAYRPRLSTGVKNLFASSAPAVQTWAGLELSISVSFPSRPTSPGSNSKQVKASRGQEQTTMRSTLDHHSCFQPSGSAIRFPVHRRNQRNLCEISLGGWISKISLICKSAKAKWNQD